MYIAVLSEWAKKVTDSEWSKTKAYLQQNYTTVNDSMQKANNNDVVHISGNENISGIKRFSDNITRNSNDLTVGLLPAENTNATVIDVTDTNDVNISSISVEQNTAGETFTEISTTEAYTDGTRDVNGTAVTSTLDVGVADNGPYIKFNGTVSNNIVPTNDNDANLGSTNSKWKNIYADYIVGDVSGTAEYATKIVNTNTTGSSTDLISSTLGEADAVRIRDQGNNTSGYVEIASSDNYNKPIYVRQYSNNFNTKNNEVTILDAQGNSSFPGVIFGTSFTGTSAKATADANGNVITTTYATKAEVSNTLSSANAYTDSEIEKLIDSAPAALDTLQELSQALGNDANYATTTAQLIGEKATDTAVVHKTGNETVDGNKTFKQSIVVDNKATGVSDSDNITDTKNSGVTFIDTTNNNSTGGINHALSTGTVITTISVNTIEGTGNNQIDIQASSDGDKAVIVHSDVEPNTGNAYSLGSNTNKWKQVYSDKFNDYVPADDTAVVHDTGDETIAGNKTFTDDVVFAAGSIQLGTTDNLTISTNGTVSNTANQIIPADSDLYNLGTRSKRWNNITVKTYNGYVPANDNNVVHTTGDESVSGVKTFANNPVVNNSNPKLNVSNSNYTVGQTRGDTTTVAGEFNVTDNAGNVVAYTAAMLNTNGSFVNELSATNNASSYLDVGVSSTGVPYTYVNQGWLCNLQPVESNTYDLGDSTHIWKDIYAGTIHGNIDGNATSATLATNDGSGNVITSTYQTKLSTAQLAAANSGITSSKVTDYDSHIADTDIHVTSSDKTTWSGKQNALTTAQLSAVNSGVTSTKVTTYDAYAATISTKADNASVVHTSGDETIEGVKTFTGSPFVSNYATTNGYFTKNNLIARNEVPSQIYHSAFRVFDKNAKTLGEYCVEKSTSGSSLLHMDVHTEDANGNDLMESLYLNLSNDGSTVSFYPGKNNRTDLGMLICKWANVYATNFYGDLVGNVTGNATSATKATQDASGNVITTTYATKTENNLKANNSDVVHLTGNETINGTKTFSAAKFNISAADIAAIIV